MQHRAIARRRLAAARACKRGLPGIVWVDESGGVASAPVESSRSRLEPVKKVARMIKRHWDGVIDAVLTNVTNARSEATNAKIQVDQAAGLRVPQPRAVPQCHLLPSGRARALRRRAGCLHEILKRLQKIWDLACRVGGGSLMRCGPLLLCRLLLTQTLTHGSPHELRWRTICRTIHVVNSSVFNVPPFAKLAGPRAVRKLPCSVSRHFLVICE